MTGRPRAVAAATLLVAAFPAVRQARGNPLDLTGFGPRASALAGACTAACTDVAANYHNPGALAAVRQVELALGYARATFDLRLDGRREPVDDSRGLQGGIVMPVSPAGVPVAFGLGLFLPDQRLTRVRALPPTKPRFALFDDKPQRLFVTANLAAEVAPGWEVGAGLTYMAATRGDVVLTGTVVVPEEAGGTSLVSAVDVDLEAVRYPSAGVRWVPAAAGGWAFGLAWRSEFSLDLDLTTVVAGDLVYADGDARTTLVEDAEFRLRSVTRVLFSPHQVALGISGPLSPVSDRLALSADLVWSRWSAFPSPAARVATALDLSPLIPDASGLIRVPPRPPAPRFVDTLAPRLGIELALGAGVTALSGYAFEPTPAPEPTGPMNLVDADRHVVAGGCRWELDGPAGPVPGPVTVEVHASAMRLVRREVHKADPADPVGDYSADGWVASFGGWVRARF